VPVYVYACSCGARWEELASLDARGPSRPCPTCGSQETAHRVPSAFSAPRRIDLGPDRSSWPRSWEAVNRGDPETVAYWRRTIERRLELERRHPELAPPPSRPVWAHEGPAGHPSWEDNAGGSPPEESPRGGLPDHGRSDAAGGGSSLTSPAGSHHHGSPGSRGAAPA
jgi:putative FmdB family regulatory protein